MAKNMWRPARVALCTCGAVVDRKTLAEINRWFDSHVVEATEGCDHAICVEDK